MFPVRSAPLIVLAVVLCLPGRAETSAEAYLGFLPAATRSQLLSFGRVGGSGASLEDLKLWRSAPFAEELKKTIGGRPATLAAEAWFVMALPRTASVEERDLELFRSFAAFSTMKGLRATSALFAGSEDFVTESYRVASLLDRRPLPDPVVTTTPSGATYILYGHEALVGDVFYELSFKQTPLWFEVGLNNLVPMKTFLFTLVQAHDLVTLFRVVPTSDKILLYVLALAKTAMVPGLADYERTSLVNRMQALAAWFESNLGRQ